MEGWNWSGRLEGGKWWVVMRCYNSERRKGTADKCPSTIDKYWSQVGMTRTQAADDSEFMLVVSLYQLPLPQLFIADKFSQSLLSSLDWCLLMNTQHVSMDNFRTAHMLIIGWLQAIKYANLIRKWLIILNVPITAVSVKSGLYSVISRFTVGFRLSHDVTVDQKLTRSLYQIALLLFISDYHDALMHSHKYFKKFKTEWVWISIYYYFMVLLYHIWIVQTT